MHQKRRPGGSNNRHHRNNNGRGKFRSGGNSGGDSQSLARQKKHATAQKEKYLNLARDAQASGERVDAEYYYQHVEHYSRVLAEIAENEPQPERRYDNANDDGDELMADADDNAGNVAEAEGEDVGEDEEQPVRAKEASSKHQRPRRRSSRSRNDDQQEIPLLSSVIPEAEPVSAAQ